MKLIVDEINKQTCPFYASKDWENDLKIEYEKGGCILDTSPCGDVLNQWNCSAEEGDRSEERR